ncbi:DUF1877 family protein [Streptomyces sp. NBC_00234]|uniref:DUF1877 family protein n=1 Tax=Streptomyces sp. NBC_00234 TaxID=2903638 RepID=UPI002E27E2A2|nr:DUF1877 family protein [Streptomyces sp. NBC_00234]
MTFHMHLRAVEHAEIRHDHAWLEEFMGAAWDWDVRRAEHDAGIAESIEKDFGSVHELYEAAGGLPEGRDGTWELPVFGGDVVHHTPADRKPPFVRLAPEETRRAAAFLTEISFDTLWESAGPRLRAAFGPGWADEDVKGIYHQHHTALRGFYHRTSTAGRGVVKAFWY